MNTINIIGRLTTDPELKTTQSGVSVCSFTLAVKRPRVKDTTDFIPVVAWRQSAEYISKYAHKGSMVAISGMLTTRKYETNNGDKRVAYEVVADSVSALSGNDSSQPSQIPTQGTNVANWSTSANEGTPLDFEVISGDQSLPF